MLISSNFQILNLADLKKKKKRTTIDDTICELWFLFFCYNLFNSYPVTYKLIKQQMGSGGLTEPFLKAFCSCVCYKYKLTVTSLSLSIVLFKENLLQNSVDDSWTDSNLNRVSVIQFQEETKVEEDDDEAAAERRVRKSGKLCCLV